MKKIQLCMIALIVMLSSFLRGGDLIVKMKNGETKTFQNVEYFTFSEKPVIEPMVLTKYAGKLKRIGDEVLKQADINNGILPDDISTLKKGTYFWLGKGKNIHKLGNLTPILIIRPGVISATATCVLYADGHIKMIKDFNEDEKIKGILDSQK